MYCKKVTALLLSLSLTAGLCACGQKSLGAEIEETTSAVADAEEKAYIEETLNLANNTDLTWTYNTDADAWVMSIVSAVVYPELPDQQGVSVCIPGAYVTGIDTDRDNSADVTSREAGEEAVSGSLVIDYEAQITSTNGQTYTAATAPVILNTGAAGYGSQMNSLASTTYASDGYINVSCGNRGKQDTATDEDRNTYYTGDAPSCLVDQKNAARFIKYNILLGNLPGSVNYMVSTGGSGGGAHAVMFAVTSNDPDFYDYEIAAGAVGIYYTEDGGYSTAVTIGGTDYEISDGAWGCIAYSPITSLAEADMAMAFEYDLDAEYGFSTPFQAQLAEYLSAAYMEYINEQNLSVNESDVGFDLNGDGDLEDSVALTIEYDPEAYPETNGYYGTYLDLYLAEFTANLQWYVDSLDYTEGWTWFDADGNALTDEEVAAMTVQDKAEAFLEGRYAKSSTGGMGGGMMAGGMDGKGDTEFDPEQLPERADGQMPDWKDGQMDRGNGGGNHEMIVGTPDAGTTQAAGSSVDSNNYATYEEMVEAYRTDIESIQAGDQYGNNLVELYNPLNYIGAEDAENPTWVRMLCGAAEGDISMLNSLNLQIAMLNAGIDATIEWQWDGGHVPSEVLGDSFSLYVDQMYGEYVNGAAAITKAAAEPQTVNGTATEATGTDLTGWVSYEDGTVSFSLADAAAYRTAGASKAIPGFDAIDYGQEDYVFGTKEQDARHWDSVLLEIFETYADTLAPLFNSGAEQ
ncbi:hypothetical protein [Pseudoflavonifractor phocaeensis]|uniref:hypothetical protein n=1 Tax=Pseudoflavonifractor phocaeensis TaxID=1870988 RepID=UPI0019560992|nr:hypothetical protein [Pseudoflavonifractor phocaeensis]MBM6887430.1 hypothetical protein [Pseudoflavonifractor phocaeensis]